MFKMKKLVLAVFIGILFSSCAKKSDYETIFSNPEQYSKIDHPKVFWKPDSSPSLFTKQPAAKKHKLG